LPVLHALRGYSRWHGVFDAVSASFPLREAVLEMPQQLWLASAVAFVLAAVRARGLQQDHPAITPALRALAAVSIDGEDAGTAVRGTTGLTRGGSGHDVVAWETVELLAGLALMPQGDDDEGVDGASASSAADTAVHAMASVASAAEARGGAIPVLAGAEVTAGASTVRTVTVARETGPRRVFGAAGDAALAAAELTLVREMARLGGGGGGGGGARIMRK